MFGKKSSVVLFPQSNFLEVYTNAAKDNHTRLEVNLLKEGSSLDLLPAQEFFKVNHFDTYTVVLNDDVVSTKSFVYDEKTEHVSKDEVIKLSESSVTFELDPEYVEYMLEQIPGKTIVRATLFNKLKFHPLKENLAKLGLATLVFESRATLESRVIEKYYQDAYFLLMPADDGDKKSLALVKNKQIYITHRFKSALPDLQKIINYSGMYFDVKTDKLFLPKGIDFKYKSTTKLDHAEFDPSTIATQQGFPSNLPLCAIGAFISDVKSDKIETSSMNNVTMPQTMSTEKQRSIVPLILVFVVTAAIVGGIVYFGFTRGENNNSPVAEVTPTPGEVIPTIAPTPTATMLPKDSKIQVLNATSINGQASVVKEKFVAGGYSDIATGNSKEKLTVNEIRLKSDGDMYADSVKSILGEAFSAASVRTNLADDSDYAVVVVIATDLSKTNSATPTAGESTEESDLTPTPTKKVTPTPTKKMSPTPTTEE